MVREHYPSSEYELELSNLGDTVHWALKGRILTGLPLPSPVDHVLSELSTMTHPFWVVLHDMKDELPRLVCVQYVTGEEWRNNPRKNEEMEPKQKQHSAVDMNSD